jgi:hypothetical protein
VEAARDDWRWLSASVASQSTYLTLESTSCAARLRLLKLFAHCLTERRRRRKHILGRFRLRRFLGCQWHPPGLQEPKQPSLCFASSHHHGRATRCFGMCWVTCDWQPCGNHGFEAVKLKCAPAIGGFMGGRPQLRQCLLKVLRDTPHTDVQAFRNLPDGEPVKPQRPCLPAASLAFVMPEGVKMRNLAGLA